MEFKGTKGKWVLLTGYKSCGVSIGNRSTMVFSNDCEEDLANALLISKAREMLEMLIKAKDEIEYLSDELNTDLRYNSVFKDLEKLIKEATEI